MLHVLTERGRRQSGHGGPDTSNPLALNWSRLEGVHVLLGLDPQPETLAPQIRCQGENLMLGAHRAASWWQQFGAGRGKVMLSISLVKSACFIIFFFFS